MEPEFITYQKFNDAGLAAELTEQLDMHDIEYFLEEESFNFDPSLVLSNATKQYAVKIKGEDFERVNQLLKTAETGNIADADKDYYLFSFTDGELMDVIVKADEWSAYDVVLARKILADRGKGISDETISKIRQSRIEELKKPEHSQGIWIVIGYGCALLGGILGIFIGWHLSTYKKTLPDGERVYDYNDEDRKHGRRIFYLSIIVFAISIIYKIIYLFSGLN